MREINLNRQKLGLEDLLFGVGIVTQIRAGQSVNVTRINAGNLPFDETQSLLEWAQSVNLEVIGNMTTQLQAIYDNLTVIGNVEDNLLVVNNLYNNIVALQSLYTNISKLQNIDNNMSELQNIDNNMSELQNIDNNMSKLQAIYLDLTNLISLYDNLSMLTTIYNNLATLNNINSQVVPNLTELLLVNDNAAQVAADKLTVAADKGIVSGYKNDVSIIMTAIESIYDTFDDRFLGAKLSDPTLDNDGNAIQDGAMYFNTSSNALKVYSLDNTTWYTIPQIYLSGLLDVTLTSVTTGDILTWNGTKWVNTRTPSFNSVKLNGGTGTQGTATWNNTELTYDLVLNDNVTLQVGQEEVVYCKNNTLTTIPNGKPVMAVGTNGNSGNILIDLHDGTKASAKRIIGLTTQPILPSNNVNPYGFVTRNGKVRGLNTTGSDYDETWVDGDILYVKATGALTNIEPADTALKMPIAFVIHAHTNGTLYVRATGIDENHDRDLINSKVSKISTPIANALIKVNADGSISNTGIVENNGNLGSGTQTFNGFGGSGFKNYIINGNFDVWQRGTSQTSDGYGSDDRWANYNNVSTKIHSRVACTDTERALFNASYFSRTVSTYVSGINSLVKKTHHIENITKLAGKTVTLSFWAKADSSKKMNVQVVDFYGTGGTPTGNGISTFHFGNVDLTSTWTKYKLTATLPSLVGKTLGTDGVQTSSFRLDFGFTFGPDRIEVTSYGMPVGQSGTFDIAQVQLEEGSVATSFEQRPYGLELSLCQRYYETNGTARCEEFRNPIVASTQYGAVRFNVQKRISPTVIVYSDNLNIINNVAEGNGNNIPCTLSSIGDTGFRLSWTNSSSASGASFKYTASAEL